MGTDYVPMDRPIELNIKLKAKERGISIRELARRLDIPEPSLHRMLKGPEYKLSLLKAVTETLETDFYEIVGIPPFLTLHKKEIKLGENTMLIVDKDEYHQLEKDNAILKTKNERLTKFLLDLQSRYLDALARHGEPPPLINYRIDDDNVPET